MPTARTTAPPPPDPEVKGRRIALNIILAAAAVDGVLLVAAVTAAAVSPDGGALKILGPLYGFGYIYLLYLTSTGAVRGRWGWWYTALVAVTLGPPGAVLGARRLLRADERAVAARPAPAPPARPTRKEQRKAATEKRRAADH
jgi:hypothetical protein